VITSTCTTLLLLLLLLLLLIAVCMLLILRLFSCNAVLKVNTTYYTIINLYDV
jgi:hypothetical protein